MEDILIRFWDHLLDRLTGPLHLRILLQPAVAVLYAVRDGLKDARADKSPYFWAIFTDTANRRALVRDGWKSVAKVFSIALVVDAIYQSIVLHWIYPSEALIVAFILAVLPYVLIRGPVNRIARLFLKD